MERVIGLALGTVVLNVLLIKTTTFEFAPLYPIKDTHSSKIPESLLFFPCAAVLYTNLFSNPFKTLLVYSLMSGGFLIATIARHKFLNRKERETGEMTARCGAACSECSYFAEGICPSCPEGDPKIRETCPIFLCAQDLGTVCTVCPELQHCDKFKHERENCPFEKGLFSLQLSMGYVIYEKNPERGIQLFKDYMNRGEFGLLVSRKFPERTKSKYSIEHVSCVWLSSAEGSENWVDPCNLSKLHHVVTDFVQNVPISVILLDGFEYLMVRNNFLSALKFVQSVMDEVVLTKSRLILSINPEAFSKMQLALIRRELIELD
jgi:hypothetical protein